MSHHTDKHPPVEVRRERQVIPTYKVGNPDPTPPINRTWGYTRVYPYSMLDEITETKQDAEHECLILENEYLRLTVLPELGGHLYAYDKIAEQDMFYRPAEIKPALIALRGAWIAGGLEFNFPVSHNPLTASPVDSMSRRNDDGSATIYIGAYEQLSRMRWTVGITLHPGTARIDTDIRLENRTPVSNRFYFWSNSAERVTAGTRFVSPVTSVRGWRGVMRYPEHEGEFVPAYSNHHIACDLFSRNIRADFFGCYDDDTDEGIVNVANHNQVTGRKYFTWGNSDDGLVWQHILSDDAGPYIEIQSGPFETQSVFKMLPPHQVMRWNESWYPVRGVGGFEFANKTVAINVRRTDGTVQILIHSVREIMDATVSVDTNKQSLLAWDGDLSPRSPAVLTLNHDPGDEPFQVLISSQADQVIAHAMVPWHGEPDELEDPPHIPEDLRDSHHECFIRGLDAEQQNEVPTARRYYEEAIAVDPNSPLPLLRLGVMEIKAGRPEQAVGLLQRANRVYPDNGEISYYLGLTLRQVGRHKEAKAAFWLARLDPHYSALGRYQLGVMEAGLGNAEVALEHFREASDHEDIGAPEWIAMSVTLRALSRNQEASQLLDTIQEADPLNLLASCERALVDEALDLDATPRWQYLKDLVRDEPQTWLELSTFYGGLGYNVTAMRLVDLSLSMKSRSLLHYHRAHYLSTSDRAEEAAVARRRAMTAQVDLVYAHRPEEEAMLRDAIASEPSDTTAMFLLGTSLFMKGRSGEGRDIWKKALELGSLMPSLHASMGWAAWKLDGDLPEGFARYHTAADLRPHDHRLYAALDAIREERGDSAQERLDALWALSDDVRGRGRLPQRLVTIFTMLGRWNNADELLRNRHFHPWEGEQTMRGVYTDLHVAHGEHLMEKGQVEAALAAFERALEYPVNVGVGKPLQSADAAIQYRAGLAAHASGDEAASQAHWKNGAAEDHHAIASLNGVYSEMCNVKLGDADGTDRLKIARETITAIESPTANNMAALGLIERTLGNDEEAHHAFKSALALERDHLLAKREIAR
jgi:tetratricopeptide (TPR) repeat protein